MTLLRDKEFTPVITFTKRDGSIRDMFCTLNDKLIPAEHAPKNEKTLKENHDVIRVYDLSEKGWRSFRVESVTGFTLVKNSTYHGS